MLPHQQLAVDIYEKIQDDRQQEPCLSTSLQKASTLSEVILLLLQFLDLHSSLQRQLTYDNLFPVFQHLLPLIRNDLDVGKEESLYYITYFIKQNFLHENLRRKSKH
jgi:hypothetical protein